MKFIALPMSYLPKITPFKIFISLTILLVFIFTLFSCVSSPTPKNEDTQSETNDVTVPEKLTQDETSISQTEKPTQDETSISQTEKPAQDETSISQTEKPVQDESSTPQVSVPPESKEVVSSIATEDSKIVTTETYISIDIAGSGTKSVEQLCSFFLANNANADKEKVYRMATFYVEESYKEGINSDIAFIQMCLETGFLRFGGLVSESMNNFCGLGSINAGNIGASFDTEQEGVRAHVQHLHAYGTTANLVGELIDPRYNRVIPHGKAPTIFHLSGTWAADKSYGDKLYNLLCRLSSY